MSTFNILRHGELDDVAALVDANELDESEVRAVLLNLIERLRATDRAATQAANVASICRLNDELDNEKIARGVAESDKRILIGKLADAKQYIALANATVLRLDKRADETAAPTVNPSILPCPFCGALAREFRWPNHYGCSDEQCGAYAANISAEQWNRRPADETPAHTEPERIDQDAFGPQGNCQTRST